MVKLKKYRVSKEICNVCKGNGYVKVVHVDYKNHIHQCWECDSEGEYYVHEHKMVPSSDAGNNNSSSAKLH